MYAQIRDPQTRAVPLNWKESVRVSLRGPGAQDTQGEFEGDRVF